jgi:hypothetical protein
MEYLNGWTVPEGMSGDPNHLRFRPTHVRSGARSCPQRLAMKVRPGLVPVEPVPRNRTRPSTYALGPVEKVLDRRAFDRRLDGEAALAAWKASEARRHHNAHGRWVEHAVLHYLKAEENIDSGLRAEGTAVEPVSHHWARTRKLAVEGRLIHHEETVTGRRFDGPGIRELRLIRYGSVEDRAPDGPEVGLAAGVVAGARRVLGGKWEVGGYRLGVHLPVERVRVVEIGLLDGTHNVIFDGTASEAHTVYTNDTEARLWRSAGGGDYVPGDDCGTCPLLGRCPAVPSVPGLLGVAEPGPHRKTWSVSTGRSYVRCPAPVHLGDLRLPKHKEAEETPATMRGRVVHDWIEAQHRREPRQSCSPHDADGEHGVPEKTCDLPSKEAALAVQMAGDHALTCPLAAPSEALDVHPEETVVAFDPTADVLVIAKADLLYRTEEGWVLRETKTARRADEGGLLERHAQLALGVLLSAHGALPGGAGGCRVELERLTAAGPMLREFVVADPVIVARARRAVTSLVEGWLKDETYKERPGQACASCSFVRWCPGGERKTNR